MNIVVCLKPVQFKSVASFNSGYELSISSQDLNTLQQAIRIKESQRDEECKVIVVAMSRMKALYGLTQLYEYGVDQVYLLSNIKYAGADTIATAYTIGQFLHTLDYNFILTSFQSNDSETGLMPPALAEELGIRCLTNVEIERVVSTKRLAVRRYYETNIVSLEIEGPVVLTIRHMDNEVKRPCFNDILHNKNDVKVISDFCCNESKIGSAGSKTRVEGLENHAIDSRKGMSCNFQQGMSILKDYIYKVQSDK